MTTRTKLGWVAAILIFAALLAAICFVIVVGGRPPPSDLGLKDWRDLLDKFQTLITGLLAVAAAFMTILQAQRAESRQLDRHREALYFGQLRDLRANERLTSDLVIRLQYLADSAEAYSKIAAPEAFGWGREAKAAYLSVLNATSNFFDYLSAISAGDRALFTAELESEFLFFRLFLKEICSPFGDRQKGFYDQYPNSDHAPAHYTPGLRESLIAMQMEAEALIKVIEKFNRSLKLR
ncbi:hypothetical protein ACCT08_15205 [Rhizobium johnstonii]|uniref:hypothetical protein n=1 Tax=Rhizobium johnstonii TaxID=3019933 RepID=UPI003F98D090